MDNTITDSSTAERLAFNRMALGLYTACPGIIIAWDADKNLATVQPATRMKIVSGTGAVSYVDLPAVENVPPCLPHSAAAGLYFTVPIKPGDCCLMIFAQRAIDNLVAYGIPDGKPTNPVEGAEPRFCELRHHDLTDAMFIPSLVLTPTAIEDWAADAIELRTADSSVKLAIKADGIHITGDVAVTGKITASGEIKAGTVPLTTHHHSDPQGGNTGGPAA